MAGHRSALPHAHALAQRVRALREDRGRTRKRLAKEAGIAVRTLGRLESEGAIQPGFLTVGAVAEALAVSLDDLFQAAQVPPVTPGLWSAGYEGRDIDSFVALLVDSRIGVVADVRLTPISRKKGFSKTRLGEALAEAGIEYTHLRGLGNPKGAPTPGGRTPPPRPPRPGPAQGPRRGPPRRSRRCPCAVRCSSRARPGPRPRTAPCSGLRTPLRGQGSHCPDRSERRFDRSERAPRLRSASARRPLRLRRPRASAGGPSLRRIVPQATDI
jgi:transcriptional regulator with XRE-family HTH domain